MLGAGRLLERGAHDDDLTSLTDRTGPQSGALAARPGVAHERDAVVAGPGELGACDDRPMAERSG